ncbi:MAG TPA: GLPGLI family protein [Bacteroidia bacterium]|nr:GLPGLI family protein [Bacteroidia bacterium]
MIISKHSLLFFVLIVSHIQAISQITYGKITYERKTNLYKKFKDDNIKEWLQEEDKNKVDAFELYFNDSVSVFRPQESDLKERYSWATSKNIVYENFKTNKQLSVKTIWGEKVFLEDTVQKRSWKITASKRNIAGYECRKAIWYMNDTTPIYAWYTNEIIPSVGPESFCNLPGAILGLATEDGGVIYFAKNVEISKPDLTEIIPAKGRNKVYTTVELKTKLQKDFGKNPWGKAMIKEVFNW